MGVTTLYRIALCTIMCIFGSDESIADEGVWCARSCSKHEISLDSLTFIMRLCRLPKRYLAVCECVSCSQQDALLSKNTDD